MDACQPQPGSPWVPEGMSGRPRASRAVDSTEGVPVGYLRAWEPFKN